MQRTGWSLAILTFIGSALPTAAQAETCSLYQKWKKDNGEGNCSVFPESSYFEVTATGGSGTLFARKIPKCKDGTDTGCASIEIKSLDGTRPYYFIDPPNLGMESSNKWALAFEGGGSCGALRGDNAATACMTGTQDPNDNYAFNGYNVFTGDPDYKEMTTRHPKIDVVTGSPIYTVPKQKVGKGILSPSATNAFSSYNRVLVNKSSFDRFMGNTKNTSAYNGDDVELFFHGRRIISAMLKDLDRTNGVISVGTNCPSWLEPQCQTVDDFSAATQVVVVGESGGAGGIIHNMEFIKGAILNRAPTAKVVFLLTSRMLPWLEAEVHWSGGFLGIWDDIYNGLSTIQGNLGTPNAVTQYSSSAYEPGGTVRGLLSSWGNPASATDLFLDAGCKAAHGSNDWRCFDEGHVALYHMAEDAFWFESLFDGVHGRSSPASFVDIVDFGNGVVDLETWGGFLFVPPDTIDPPSSVNWSFSNARANRVLYTSESMLQQHPGAGVLGFYEPAINCHTTIYSSAFWSDKLMKNGGSITSLQTAFMGWLTAIVVGSPQDRAWIQDGQSPEALFWSSGIYGGGWTTSSATCPQ